MTLISEDIFLIISYRLGIYLQGNTCIMFLNKIFANIKPDAYRHMISDVKQKRKRNIPIEEKIKIN